MVHMYYHFPCPYSAALVAVLHLAALLSSGGGGALAGVVSPQESWAWKLRNELLTNRKYDKMVRPVKNVTAPTNVDIRVTITRIISLDVKTGVLSLDTWNMLKWTDDFLNWNPSDYGGLSEVYFASTEIWKPDITLITSADLGSMITPFANAHLRALSNGTVIWFTPAVLNSVCRPNITNYPYDKQTCFVEFTSWAYEVHQVNLTTHPEKAIYEIFHMESPNWAIDSVNTWRYDGSYEGYGNFSSVEIDLVMRRKDSIYAYVVSGPGIMAVLLSLAMFCLPVHSSVRLNLGLLSLAIFTLLLLFLGFELGIDQYSASHSVRNIYTNMFLVAGAVLVTVALQKLHLWMDHLPMLPYAVSSLFHSPIGKLICFGTDVTAATSGGKVILNSADDAEQLTGAGRGAPSTKSANEWSLILILIDRILFVVYSLIMLVRHA